MHVSLLLLVDFIGFLTLKIIDLTALTFLVHLPLTNPHCFILTHDFCDFILGQYDERFEMIRTKNISNLPEEKVKKIKDEALEKFLISLNNATDYSCTVSKHFDFADLIAIRHFMHNVDFGKLLKLAHLRGWKHSEKWSERCPVCLAKQEFTIKATI